MSGVIARWWRHLTMTPWALGRAFSPATLAAIDAAVAAGERVTQAEIRVAVETGFGLRELWAGLSPRARALEVFSALRVWDTAGNNGVLIYVLLAEHDIEIVADRAFAARVPAAEFAAICTGLQAAFAAGDYRGGTVAAVTALARLAAPHFPPAAANPNELPDSTVLL